MLVDLEARVKAAKARFADEEVSSRCKLLAADLTQSVPAGADVHMRKHVLHGRRDEEAIKILKYCRAVIPANGSLLVIEFILPPLISQADPHLEGHLMSDLNMLAVTGGRASRSSGFSPSRSSPVGNDVGILEAKPAQA
jgi:hypothetical protein